jgi:hypothetical protein
VGLHFTLTGLPAHLLTCVTGLPAVASHVRTRCERRLERETGIEPATNSLEGCDSTTELLPPSRLALFALSTLRRASPVSRLALFALSTLRRASPLPRLTLHFASNQQPLGCKGWLANLSSHVVPDTSESWLASRSLHPVFQMQAKAGGQGRIRTSVALGRQIYSLLRLTAPPPAHFLAPARRHGEPRQLLCLRRRRPPLFVRGFPPCSRPSPPAAKLSDGAGGGI